MRMDAGSVTRKRKAVLIYKAAAHGWDDGGGEDDFYKALLSIKEFCGYLGIGQTKARKLLRGRNGFGVQIGN